MARRLNRAAERVQGSRRERLLPLSGVAFAVPFLIGWFASAGVTPHYSASDQDWTDWAHDSKWNGRVSGFAMLIAAFLFLHYLGAIRSVLGRAESALRGSAQLARVAFGGAVIGVAGMSMALVMMAAASSEGGNANPVVTRAVTAAAAGPYLIAAMGFAAFCFLRALRTVPQVRVELGRFQRNKVTRRLADDATQSVRVIDFKEKGSDVNLASRLLADAYEGECEMAAVLSSDSDLRQPIQIADARLPRGVVVLNPNTAHARSLERVASGYIRIRNATFRASLFPDEITPRIRKPDSW